MKFLLPVALLSLGLPTAASAATVNMGATLVTVNQNMGIGAASLYAASAKPMLAMQTTTPCLGGSADPNGNCPGGAQCVNSPENPTALLAILGATGLFLGRLGYGRMRNRTAAALPTVA